MSYQLDLDQGKKPKIEMPPLPQENPTFVGQMVESQSEIQQDLVENVETGAQAISEDVSHGLQALQEPQEVQPQVQQESFQAKNFRQLRQEAERIKQERDEMAARLAAYESNRRQVVDSSATTEPELNINDDDLLEGKHLKQYAKKIQQLEQKLQQQQQQTIAQLAQTQLRAKFPDFDKVVNEDNIEQLRYAYPELANTLNSSNDLYSTAVSAYTMIKKLGIATDEKASYAADKAQAQRNMAKPRPLASVSPQQGDSPLSKANAFANGLTDDLRAQLLKEMNAARNS